MAGSAFRPLTNIPYCCLPQESGPCLSTSVGDRPLRSPTHRRPGGPSPRLLSNGTHARPRPPQLYPPGDASLRNHGVLSGVSTGYPPVGGWLHTRCAPVRHSRTSEGALTVRLACIRPAASVHPEPGSNPSLYYCFSCLYSESRVPPRCSLGVPFKRFLPSRRSRGAGILCWPQTFKELR